MAQSAISESREHRGEAKVNLVRCGRNDVFGDEISLFSWASLREGDLHW